MLVIGLSGWKRSGKDMLAEYLIREHGFKRLAFADPLKETVMADAKLSREQVYSQALKEMPLSQYPLAPKDEFSRHIAEIMWSECRFADGSKPSYGKPFRDGGKYIAVKVDAEGGQTSLEPLYFTPRALLILAGSVQRSWNSDFWVEKAFAGLDPNGRYVIADLRYRSEIAACDKAVGEGKFVPVRIERFDTNPSTDSSECDLDCHPFWHRINNKDSTKEEACAQMEQILKEIEG